MGNFVQPNIQTLIGDDGLYWVGCMSVRAYVCGGAESEIAWSWVLMLFIIRLFCSVNSLVAPLKTDLIA